MVWLEKKYSHTQAGFGVLVLLAVGAMAGSNFEFIGYVLLAAIAFAWWNEIC